MPIEPPWHDWCGFLYDANLAGLPACAVPVGLGDDGLPVSVQLLGLRGHDGAVLAAAEAVERLVAFDARPPALVRAQGAARRLTGDQVGGRNARKEGSRDAPPRYARGWMRAAGRLVPLVARPVAWRQMGPWNALGVASWNRPMSA